MHPRRCIVVRSPEPAETRRAAEAVVAGLSDVLWVGGDDLQPAEVKGRLGGAHQAVVLDLHAGFDPDLLGRCHGFVQRGGALILRMPDQPVPSPALAVHPHTPDEVGTRMWARLEAALARDAAPPRPLRPCPAAPQGHPEQQRLVDELVDLLGEPHLIVLTADRGRGKSSALGLAVRQLPGAPRVAVTAERPGSAAEVFRFAGPRARYVAPEVLASGEEPYDVIVVDEAAGLAVPRLERIVRAHPQAAIALATTTRGYEGTGRGFTLRFLSRLSADPRPLTRRTLTRPIRWDPGDPLEALVFDVLALDAEPAPPDALTADPTAVVLDRDRLAADEALLRELFGLLLHAHYRTTPSDLHRLLDAPNLVVHALLSGGHVAGACLVAREGGLPPDLRDAMAQGALRVRGHALADTLVTHAGRPDAGALQMIRSVRIAVHPSLRGRGLGRRLVEHVHQTHAPDLFGTVFSADPGVVRFRKRLGYAIVRVGSSRGARTGEPPVVMVRPRSRPAQELVDALRAELTRDLPGQLTLLDHDEDSALDPSLREELLSDLPAAAPLPPGRRDALIREYLRGPRPFEATLTALRALLAAHPERLTALSPSDRALVTARVVEARPWRALARELGVSVPTVMRAMKRAVMQLFPDGDGRAE